MPYISTEALVGAALLAVLVFGYQYLPISENGGATADGATSKRNKKKKKSKSAASLDSAKQETAGTVTVSASLESDMQKKGKGAGKGKGKSLPEATATQPESQPTLSQPIAPTSFAAAAGGSPSMPTPKPKTLAEKLVPKPRKTKVDDMLEPEDRPPSLARVMKITPSGGAVKSTVSSPVPVQTTASAPEPESKVAKFEEDYADSESDSEDEVPVPVDDGWNVVPTSKKKPVSLSIGGSRPTSASGGSASDAQTKLQRKNAKKAELKKAQRAAEEAERLHRLAMHKRDLQRERINEIYTSQKKADRSGSSKVLSGGQNATVTSNGKLVWD